MTDAESPSAENDAASGTADVEALAKVLADALYADPRSTVRIANVILASDWLDAVRRNAADDRADDLRNDVIDGMTVPPGGPDDPFWQGAQWAYGQVREALNDAYTTGHAWSGGRCANCDAEVPRPWAERCAEPGTAANLSLALRQAARDYLGLAEGDFWPSEIAAAQARALLDSGWRVMRLHTDECGCER